MFRLLYSIEFNVIQKGWELSIHPSVTKNLRHFYIFTYNGKRKQTEEIGYYNYIWKYSLKRVQKEMDVKCLLLAG